MQFTSNLTAWAGGFMVCLALVASIGAQNLFLLRQAVAGRHVSACVAWCVVSDVALTAIGVVGMAQVLAGWPGLAFWLTLGGAVFLLCYGLRAWARLLPGKGGAVHMAPQGLPATRSKVLAALAALTLLNPHVYLDTVLLAGSIGAREVGSLKLAFLAGGASASLIWFLSLAFAGRKLQAVFARPAAWRVLDAFTGASMLALAAWVGLLSRDM